MWEKNENKQKEAGFGPFKKYSCRYPDLMAHSEKLLVTILLLKVD